MLFPNITMRLFYQGDNENYNDVFLNAGIDVIVLSFDEAVN